jgi:hypothetical protein
MTTQILKASGLFFLILAVAFCGSMVLYKLIQKVVGWLDQEPKKRNQKLYAGAIYVAEWMDDRTVGVYAKAYAVYTDDIEKAKDQAMMDFQAVHPDMDCENMGCVFVRADEY